MGIENSDIGHYQLLGQCTEQWNTHNTQFVQNSETHITLNLYRTVKHTKHSICTEQWNTQHSVCTEQWTTHNTQCTSLVSLKVFKIIKENRFLWTITLSIPATCSGHKRALKVTINAEATSEWTFKICYTLDAWPNCFPSCGVSALWMVVRYCNYTFLMGAWQLSVSVAWYSLANT
jgi:hypothetical protein